MATYNRAHFIIETLVSIQNQIFSDWECLIIDDGGTDNTLEVLQPILEHDKRFSYHARLDSHKKGLPGCRNYGLDLAKGDHIIFFDDDDIVHPSALQLSLEVLIKTKLDFCHFQKKSFEKIVPGFVFEKVEVERELSLKNLFEIISGRVGLASCTVLWKKECFAGERFVESLQYAEEWECYSRIISNDIKGVIISNILYFNRKHPNSNTSEFYNKSSLRVGSKIEAVKLIYLNLLSKDILDNKSYRFLKSFVYRFDSNELNLFIKANNSKSIKNRIMFKLIDIRVSLFFMKKRCLNLLNGR